jgi:hypothetical protein
MAQSDYKFPAINFHDFKIFRFANSITLYTD